MKRSTLPLIALLCGFVGGCMVWLQVSELPVGTGASAGMPYNQPGGGYNSGYGGGANRNKAGKSTASGGRLISDGSGNRPMDIGRLNTPPGKTDVSPGTPGQNTLGGKTGASGDQSNAGNTSVLPAPSPAPQYDQTGRLIAEGTSPYVADASPGQIAGALFGLAPGGLGLLNSAPDVVDALTSKRPPNAAPTGGLVGRGVDALLGTTPGGVTGYTANRVASNTNSRSGSREIPGQAYGAGTRALTGDSESDVLDAAVPSEYSDVMLRDRRRPYGAGTRVLLGV